MSFKTSSTSVPVKFCVFKFQMFDPTLDGLFGLWFPVHLTAMDLGFSLVDMMRKKKRQIREEGMLRLTLYASITFLVFENGITLSATLPDVTGDNS